MVPTFLLSKIDLKSTITGLVPSYSTLVKKGARIVDRYNLEFIQNLKGVPLAGRFFTDVWNASKYGRPSFLRRLLAALSKVVLPLLIVTTLSTIAAVVYVWFKYKRARAVPPRRERNSNPVSDVLVHAILGQDAAAVVTDVLDNSPEVRIKLDQLFTDLISAIPPAERADFWTSRPFNFSKDWRIDCDNLSPEQTKEINKIAPIIRAMVPKKVRPFKNNLATRVATRIHLQSSWPPVAVSHKRIAMLTRWKNRVLRVKQSITGRLTPLEFKMISIISITETLLLGLFGLCKIVLWLWNRFHISRTLEKRLLRFTGRHYESLHPPIPALRLLTTDRPVSIIGVVSTLISLKGPNKVRGILKLLRMTFSMLSYLTQSRLPQLTSSSILLIIMAGISVLLIVLAFILLPLVVFKHGLGLVLKTCSKIWRCRKDGNCLMSLDQWFLRWCPSYPEPGLVKQTRGLRLVALIRRLIGVWGSEKSMVRSMATSELGGKDL